MSGSEKNNHGETDSIKEMLERLRRSVTDLPPETEGAIEPEPMQQSTIQASPAEEEKAAPDVPSATVFTPKTEELSAQESNVDVDFAGEDEALTSDPVADEEDELSHEEVETVDDTPLADDGAEMILVPWEEDTPIPDEDEEPLFDVLPEDISPETEDDAIVEEEDLSGSSDVDDETIAQFFQAVEETDEEASLTAVRGEMDESTPDAFSVEESPAEELPADDLPTDFIDVTDEEEEDDLPADISYSSGAPVITDDEAALLFRSSRPAMPDAPAAPPRENSTSTSRAVEANEDNGYAVEVEVRRPTATAPAEPVQEEHLPAEAQTPTATHGLSNGSTLWRDNQNRRRPVEVLEDTETEEPSDVKFGELLGKTKSAEAENQEKEVLKQEQPAPQPTKRDKAATKPFGPGKQLTIDDIREERDGTQEGRPGFFARLLSKNASKKQADPASASETSSEEAVSIDIKKEKELRQIQKAERRSTSGTRPSRAQEALGGLYREEAAAYHEYTSRSQMSLFQQKFESELSFLALRIGILSFLAVMLLVLENGIGWGLPMERLFVVPISMVGLHLLLVFFALLCCIPLFAHAWRQLFAKRLVSEAFVAISLLLSLLYDAILCFSLIPAADGVSASLADLSLFGLLPVVAALVSTVVDFNKVKSDLSAFRLVASSGDKLACAVNRGGATKAETAAVSDLEEGADTRIVSVKKIGFATGFFHRISRNCEDEQKNLWLLPTAGVAALLVAVITGILEKNVLDAIYSFCVTLSLALPACMLVLRKLPVSLLFRWAENQSCAVVGEVSALEYSDTGAVAFEDVEAFPARNVRVQRIKLYNDSALDHVLYQVAGVFSAVGGPLDGVFRSSTAELGLSSDVHLLQVADGGIIASVDGRRICVGCGDFMLKKHVRMYYDAEDEQNLAAGKTCIMYAAEEGQLCAKFYIRYRMDEEFERDVERLSANHIRVLIRTYDPNIRELLIEKISYTGRFGIRVVRKTVEQQNDFAAAQLNSGIISLRSVREILRVLLACRRTCRLTSYSEMGGLVLGCVGMLVSIILAMFGVLLSTPSLLLCLYQLFWILPVLLASKLYITRK